MPVLFTERVPLATVFRNLIQNAYKHHDCHERGCVTIAAADLGDVIQFGVADDGPGIAPEFHEQLFELFRTLKPRDEVEGSGMGSSIHCRHEFLSLSTCSGQPRCFDDFDHVPRLFTRGAAGTPFDDSLGQLHDIDVEMRLFQLTVVWRKNRAVAKRHRYLTCAPFGHCPRATLPHDKTRRIAAGGVDFGHVQRTLCAVDAQPTPRIHPAADAIRPDGDTERTTGEFHQHDIVVLYFDVDALSAPGALGHQLVAQCGHPSTEPSTLVAS